MATTEILQLQPERPQANRTGKAEKVGGLILCLDLLANEAAQEGMRDIAAVMDDAIMKILRLAYDKYIAPSQSPGMSFDEAFADNASFIEELYKGRDSDAIQALIRKVREELAE